MKTTFHHVEFLRRKTRLFRIWRVNTSSSERNHHKPDYDINLPRWRFYRLVFVPECCKEEIRESLKLNQYDFRFGAHAHRRTPGPRAAGGVDQQISQPFKAVSKLSPNARDNPCERKYLATVSVARELQ